MRSALMVFADEMGQDARDDGRGGQDQDVVHRQPCSEQTLGCVGDAVFGGVHLDDVLLIEVSWGSFSGKFSARKGLIRIRRQQDDGTTTK